MAEGESFEACVGRVARAGAMGRGDALALLQQVHDRAEAMRATGSADPFLEAASKLASEQKETARLDRLDAIRNAAKRAEILSKVTGFNNAPRVLRDILHGSNEGDRQNVQSEWLGRASVMNAAVDVELKRHSLSQAAISGQEDRGVARALWAKNEGTEANASRPAKQMADTYHPAMEQIKDLQNEHGARIGDAPDYVMHTWHDPLLMRRGGRGASGSLSVDEGFTRWMEWTLPKLSEKTFEDVEPEEGETQAVARLRFMRSVYEALVSGVHMTTQGSRGIEGDGNMPLAYEGTHNIAKRVSKPRVLFWKDADSWYDYNQKYGRYRTIYEGVQQTINQGSRNVALMDKLGTNPSGNLNVIVRRIQEKFREDLDGGKVFAAQIPGIQNVMARLDGSANIPIDSLWHSLGEGARQYYNMVSLGGVGITHAASIWATVPSELRHHGIGVGTDALGVGNIPGSLANIGRVAQMLVRGKGPIERQAITADLGAYAGGWAYNLSRNWNLLFEPGNTPMGRVSALHTLFMKATGIHYLYDTVRAGVREFASANLGRQLSGEFSALDPHLQQMLGKYGIGETEWGQLRAAPDLRQWEGRTYLTPRDALQTPGGQVLADKLMMYYHDIGDHAVVVPGVRERAMLYGAMRPGDPRYEAMRLLTQFKIWPVAAANQILGREIHMALNAKDAAWGIGLTIALSTLGGYSRMAVNDLALGNVPRDPRNPETLLAGLAQGGGLGIFGDLVFGEVNRLGASGISAAAGPAFADADTLVRIYGRWRTNMRLGRPSDFWPDLARFGIGHVPFANLVFVKGALDYLLWYHLLEAAKPGWWQRTNQRMQVEQGRTMAGYTPGGPIPWSPWALGATY